MAATLSLLDQVHNDYIRFGRVPEDVPPWSFRCLPRSHDFSTADACGLRSDRDSWNNSNYDDGDDGDDDDDDDGDDDDGDDGDDRSKINDSTREKEGKVQKT
ncbi:hypothetical protein GX48_07209 [Paracoccidioides brasiliensis]|nr:hypothetical protein GX48_07209 [Paracoccidioides brasiliensis]